jgi:branched-chain amino acid transport system permease protein
MPTRFAANALARHTTPLVLAFLVIVVALAGGAGSPVLETVTTTLLIYLIVVVALYMFIGNSGVFSFGHIGFMAVGAYTAAAFRIPPNTKALLFPGLPETELGSLEATLAGGAAAAAVALVVALPLMRLSGLVASLGTFAFLNIVFVIASNWNDVTGGSTGLGGVPTTTTRTTALVWALLVIAVAWWYQQTSLCLRLRATREDEAAARAAGIGVTGERTFAFVLSAFITGVGGALYAQFLGTFGPTTFFIAITFMTVAMLVVGGRLSLSGAVIGTLFISVLAEGVRRIATGLTLGPVEIPSLPGLQQLTVALVMLLVLITRPRGLTNSEEITALSLRRAVAVGGAAIWRVPSEVRRATRPDALARGGRRLTRAVSAARPAPAERAIADDGAPESVSRGRAAAPLLTVRDLEVRYGRITAVRGISLHVEEGEIVALVGPNGAGKSTTLSAVAGFLAPTAGSIAFGGRSLLGQPPERIVRRGVALVPEGRQIFGTLTVAENLQLGSTPLADRGRLDEALEDVLKTFPILGTYYRSSAAKLSGGEQQQLAIARALLSQPRLLLLDEPSLGLAPLMVDLVFDVLGELRAGGTTILLVEQNATAAIELADRAYVLGTGRVVAEGTGRELLAEADLAATYLGVR